MDVPGTPLTFVSGEALDVPSQEQNFDQEEILVFRVYNWILDKNTADLNTNRQYKY